MDQHYPFTLMPLPYSYDALTPVLDETTLCYHHDKHLKAYVDNLNGALANHPELQELTLSELIRGADTLPADIRTPVKNNAGGVYNHQAYFECMSPTMEVNEAAKKAIENSFGTMEAWREQMKEAGVKVFGSGWAWLVKDSMGKLKIIQTANQDTPLTLDLKPVLPMDVWEHAYYLQYQNRRPDYVDNWFSIINWNQVLENMELQ